MESGKSAAVRFSHTIVHCRDKRASAVFLAEILGLPEPQPFGHPWDGPDHPSSEARSKIS